MKFEEINLDDVKITEDQENEYAILPLRYLDELAAYDVEARGRIMTAILIFRATGEKVQFDGVEKYAMPRIYADQRRAAGKYSKKKAAAKAAAESRWSKADADGCERMQTDANASNAIPNKDKDKIKDKDNSPSESIPPLPPKRGRRKTTQELPDADFDAFWALYPKKKSKGEAKKAWAQIKPSRETISAIMAKLPLLIASHDWTKEGGRYIPNPATWLRAEGWEDEVTSPPKPEAFAYDNSTDWGYDGF